MMMNSRERVANLFAGYTPDLLVNASPEEVKKEVNRLKGLFGPRYIISPSHEAILPNIPLENVEAIAEAALEYG